MNIYEDLKHVQTRTGVLQYALVFTVGTLLSVFWYVQVLRGRHYRTQADNNQSRIIPLAAPRGPLLDREGQVLVENRPSFSIILRPEDCPDLDGTITRLSRLLRIGEGQIRERIARRGAPFQPVVVKTNATQQDVASVEARRLELPQVEVDPVPLRSYPMGALGAHVFGRVGEVSERQLQTPEHAGIRPGTLVGQAGLEAAYNERLMGKEGFRRVIVNSRGVEEREADRQNAVDGPTLTLTLDARLQRAMEEAFGDREGAGVALDPATGEILALVSRPAYDPNDFATGIDPALWARLATDPNTPLLNRTIQGQYSPGSLFKIVMATAALEEGVITPETTLNCAGQITLYDTVFHCLGVHGAVDVRRAIQKSCNVFFFQMGVRLAINRIARYAELFGLGAPTQLPLPHEAAGRVPDPEWKKRTQGLPWWAGETVSVAIGQGQLTVTPVQMACVAASVANGGYLVKPQLVRAVGREAVPLTPPRPTGIKPETLAVIRDAMSAVVNENGTGAGAKLKDVEVCGKTGSAQVVSRERLRRSGGAKEEMQPHGWFVGFAPKEHPRVAFAFLVEHGRSGAASAVPVARAFLTSIFEPQAGVAVARVE